LEFVVLLKEFDRGGFGRFIGKVVNAAGQITGLSESPFDITKMPFGSAFFGYAGDERAVSGQYNQVSQDALQADWAVKAAYKASDTENAGRMRKQYAKELRMVPTVKAADKELKSLKEQEVEVQNNPRLDRAQRLERMDRIIKQRQKIEERVLKQWRGLVDAGL